MRDGIAVYEVTIWLCFGWDFLGEFLLFGWLVFWLLFGFCLFVCSLLLLSFSCLNVTGK